MFTHVQNAIALRSAQLAYDNMTPPDDPPEAPDMYWEVNDLLNGQNTDLLGYEQFKQMADERIHDLLPEGWLIEFLRESAVSLEPNRRLAAKPIREALEQIAGELLDEKWQQSLQQGEEP